MLLEEKKFSIGKLEPGGTWSRNPPNMVGLNRYSHGLHPAGEANPQFATGSTGLWESKDNYGLS